MRGHNLTRQAVVEFQGEFMNTSDLSVFFRRFVPDYTAGDDVVSRFVGPHHEDSKGIEAELDVQYLMGVAPGVHTEFWEFPSQDFGSDLNAWTTQVLVTKDAPLVWSVSYGWQGNLSLVHTKAADVEAIEINLAKLAARGFSILFSSGDSGSGYIEGDSGCKKPDVGKAVSGTVLKTFENVPHMYMCCNEAHGEYARGWSCVQTGKNQTQQQQQLVPEQSDIMASAEEEDWVSPPPPASGCGRCTLYSKISGRPAAANTTQSFVQSGRVQLWASWPASSPFVTAVGGTQFADQHDASLREVAVTQFGSGGGFSTMYKQLPHAAWQAAAVAQYLRTVDPSTLPPKGSIGFDPAARGTPDFSVLAEGYNLIADGAVHVVGGTSAAAPAAAALISLLNEARVAAGKQPMGFANPFLYGLEAEAFTDVVVGSNKRDRQGTPWPYGYNASAGWDPVTGLGTPRFEKLLAAAMAC
jgi:subtilase family serine protease